MKEKLVDYSGGELRIKIDSNKNGNGDFSMDSCSKYLITEDSKKIPIIYGVNTPTKMYKLVSKIIHENPSQRIKLEIDPTLDGLFFGVLEKTIDSHNSPNRDDGNVKGTDLRVFEEVKTSELEFIHTAYCFAPHRFYLGRGPLIKILEVDTNKRVVRVQELENGNGTREFPLNYMGFYRPPLLPEPAV